MFERHDVVKVIYCPSFPALEGHEAVIEWPAGQQFLSDLDSVEYVPSGKRTPTEFQKSNCWYTTTAADGKYYRAIVAPKVEVGQVVTVNDAGPNWKELKGKRFYTSSVYDDGSVLINHMIPVRVYNYTPIRKETNMSYLVPGATTNTDQGIAREDIARVMAEVIEGRINSHEAMQKLGISIKDDLDYTKDYSIDFSVSLPVTFPKGIATGDRFTIIMAVAEKLAGKNAAQIADILLEWSSEIYSS